MATRTTRSCASRFAPCCRMRTLRKPKQRSLRKQKGGPCAPFSLEPYTRSAIRLAPTLTLLTIPDSHYSGGGFQSELAAENLCYRIQIFAEGVPPASHGILRQIFHGLTE